MRVFHFINPINYFFFVLNKISTMPFNNLYYISKKNKISILLEAKDEISDFW